MKLAVYPGSFDPITNGHLNIIKRASALVDELIVVVFRNIAKKGVFSPEERLDFIKRVTKDIPNVKTDMSDGLLVDYFDKVNASVVVKGMRAVSDFEFEFQMNLINRKLNKNIETIFLISDLEYLYLSSSLVREVGGYGGDISEFVPPEIIDDVMRGLAPSGI